MARRSLGTLTLDLIAKIAGYEQGMSRADRVTQRAMKNINRSITTASRSLLTFVGIAGFRQLSGSVKGYADEYINLNNRLKLATNSQEDLTRAQVKTFEIAQDTRQAFGATAELYQRLSLSSRELNLTQEDLARITETVNKTLVISGATAEGAEGAIVQFGQGLAAGAVRGQEFNSVAEQAPRLMQALADGLGKNIGELREFANQGGLTAEIVIKALKGQTEQIDKEFRQTSTTISQASTKIRNTLIRLTGEQEASAEASQDLVSALDDLRAILEDPAVAKGLATLVSGVVKVGTASTEALAGIAGLTKFLAEEVATFRVGIEPGDIVRLEDEADKIREILDRNVFNPQVSTSGGRLLAPLVRELGAFGEKIRFFGPDGIVSFKSDAELRAELAKIEAVIDGHYNVPANRPKVPVDIVVSSGDDTAFKPSKDLLEFIEKLKEQVALLGKGASATAAFKAEQLGANEAYKNLAASLAATVENFKKQQEAAQASAKFIETLQRQVDLLGTEGAAANARYEASLLTLNEAQKARVEGLLQEIEAFEAREEAAEAQKKINEEAISLARDLLSEEEAIRLSYEERKKVIEDATNFEIAEKQRLLDKLAEQRDEELKNTDRAQQFQALIDSLKTEEEAILESFQRRREIILENTQANGEAQTELLKRLEADRNEQLAELEQQRLKQAEDLFSGLAGLAKAAAGEQSGIYRALFAVEKAAAIARSIVAIQTAIANAAASGPFPANLAAMASVASATAGIISAITSTNIEGVAHAGLDSVPTTGTYLLERGERVTTEKTSAKLDQTLDQVQQTQQQPASGAGNLRIINAFDSQVIGDYMGSTDGEEVIMNTVRRNQATIQQISRG